MERKEAQDEQNGHSGREQEQEDAAVSLGQEAADYPNMVFVPMTVEPVDIPAREFGMYILLLLVFMITLTGLNLDDDWAINDSTKALTNIAHLQTKVTNAEGYILWFPALLKALRRWQTKDNSSDAKERAVLVGAPIISQRVTESASKSREQLMTNGEELQLPPLNATAGHECPWEMRNITNSSGSITDVACFAATTMRSGHAEYVLPVDLISGILNGELDWSPELWITKDTIELTHAFTLYYHELRRFAVVEIVLSFDSSGRILIKSLDSQAPSFETHEPFFSETHPWETLAELFFAIVMIYNWVNELFEIVHCSMMTELLLPMEILTTSMQLQLYEILYFHESANEVYDPRDPRTGKAFAFPDVDDLKAHIKTTVRAQTKLHEEEKVLHTLKVKMAKLGYAITHKQTTGGETMDDLHLQMVDTQVKLMNLDKDLRFQIRVAETAAVLQLVVCTPSLRAFCRSALCLRCASGGGETASGNVGQ